MEELMVRVFSRWFLPGRHAQVSARPTVSLIVEMPALINGHLLVLAISIGVLSERTGAQGHPERSSMIIVRLDRARMMHVSLLAAA